jgi:hypothetical protein
MPLPIEMAQYQQPLLHRLLLLNLLAIEPLFVTTSNSSC